MKKFSHCVRWLSLMAVVNLFSGVAIVPVMAATMTYNFSGTVTVVPGKLNTSPSVFGTSGTPSVMRGTMTVDKADDLPDPRLGQYWVQTFQVTIGSYTATLSWDAITPGESGPGHVVAPSSVGVYDGVQVYDFHNTDVFRADVLLRGAPVNLAEPSMFQIELFGRNNIFSNDVLPASVPNLASFMDRNQFRLIFVEPSGAAQTVSGTLTSLTAVPLPASMVLFGIGLVALVGLKVRWRQPLHQRESP